MIEDISIVVDGNRHCLDILTTGLMPVEGSSQLTACGIRYVDREWSTDAEGAGVCWQCIKVNSLQYSIKFLTIVLDAAMAWEADPDSGPLRGGLAAALDEYRKYWVHMENVDIEGGEGGGEA